MKPAKKTVIFVSEHLLKAIRKGSIPEFITDKFYKWRRDVELLGIRTVRKIPSYHDEPIRGSPSKSRSVRLNQAWRLFYVESETNECQIIASKKLTSMSIDEITIEGKRFIEANKALANLDREITLGRLMRSLRLCENITLTAMAEKIGVNKQFLSAVENDRKKIGIEFIAAFANILGTPYEPLLEIYFRDTLRKHGLNLQVSVTKAS